MRFLLLNQAFHPDVVSTAQHLTDLALGLVQRGHHVTVIASRRAYDSPATRFPKTETWRGIQILRVGGTGFGKSARWRRAADFASFLALLAVRLPFLPRPDVVVALTSPPLISSLAAAFARLRRARFLYWLMDFNPDAAIAAGWLRSRPLAAALHSLSRFSLRHASKIIALDRFMRDRLIAKAVPPRKISVIPPWSHDAQVQFSPAGRDAFRKAHGLHSKFVVMHSGNHSPCHPLDTLLAAARQLAHQPDILFCFVGGGSEFPKIQQLAGLRPPPANILCLPYQPLSRLSDSLSAADLHVVPMGDPFVGLLHPCKIYNLLNLRAPILCLGPHPSHLSDILRALPPRYPAAAAPHGDVQAVLRHIQHLRRQPREPRPDLPPALCRSFSRQTLLPKLIAELESC